MTTRDALRGLLIYGAGDAAAAALGGEFAARRLVGMALVGATLYALEIPAWFRWIDRRSPRAGAAAAWRRTGWAMLYFNPLWIARHLLFIRLFQGRFDLIRWSLVSAGAGSFLVNVPISAAANWLIQNRVPAPWRFAASATFSAMMAVYYAWSGARFQFHVAAGATGWDIARS